MTVIVGLRAVTAALVGRHLIRSGIIGKRAAEQWVEGEDGSQRSYRHSWSQVSCPFRLSYAFHFRLLQPSFLFLVSQMMCSNVACHNRWITECTFSGY
ncbi:hypothetical protein J3A83DRAFT_364150 [Scleroderma citrinum]